METNQSPNKVIIGIIVVVLLVAAGTAIVVLGSKPASEVNTANDLPLSTTTAPSVDPNVIYKDGTYSATGSYQTPGGQEAIGVKVTLKNNVISDASVIQEGQTGEAQEFQAAFASGFKPQVVGKKISEVSLSRVAGSSLTSNGFNNAISDIANQAKA